jgi:proliferating cell nuclear antigen PCNA
MKLIISDKHKKELFIALFKTLKNCTSILNLIFDKDKLQIQGMDKSHVCLFNVVMIGSWFNEYILDEKCNISFDSQIFYTILCIKQESNIIIHYEDSDPDHLNLELICNKETIKGEFNKYFKIPLVNYEYELMELPVVEYDAEFIISSKHICEIVSQMITFGDDLQIKCSEDKIELITNGIAGEMMVNIPIDDLNEYSIVEDESIDLKYSISYVNKMCLTNNISTDISFQLSSDFPMKIIYNLGNESSLVFFIAPKIND